MATDFANKKARIGRQLRLFLGLVTLLATVFLTTSSAGNPTNQVITWGGSGNNQLGRPTPQSDFSPAAVVGLGAGSGVTVVAAGTNHSLALKSDGSVWAWGSNSNGQLGDGTTTSRLTPFNVDLGPGVKAIAIAAGNAHSLAVKEDGSVWAWGLNSNGQLGDGTTSQRLVPTQVLNLLAGSNVTVVAAGSSHSLALKSDGSVMAWGFNSDGELGDGTNVQKTSPVAVTGLGSTSGVVGVIAGGFHSVARKSDGTLLAWGANSTGQLGDGTTTSRNIPVAVVAIDGVTAISGGNSHTLALRSNGTVWAWGSNSSGQLGDGTFNQRNAPIQVSDPSHSGFLTGVAISAGSLHSLAVQANGTVLAWGMNGSGQLGIGSTNGSTSFSNVWEWPVQVSGFGSGSGIEKVAAGNTHSLSVNSNGEVSAWGANFSGQLGRGTFDGTPLPVPNLPDVTKISSGPGSSHTLVIKSDGSVWAWGFNLSGQLGDGTSLSKNFPVKVLGLPVGQGNEIKAIAAGNSHSLALTNNGGVYAWGSNSNGQIGDGTLNQRNSAVPVSGLLSGVIAIAAGGSHSLAVKADGTVWAWGLNGNGQLGDGTLNQRLTPVQVSGLTTATAVAAGAFHSLALKSDGSAWAWGLNSSGQLGDATNSQRNLPVQVKGIGGAGFLTLVNVIAAGSTHSLALMTSDGSVLAWGSNGSGQLGDGGTANRNTPGAVTNLGAGTGVTSLAGGALHSAALKSDGSILAWGSNSSGQLGDGTLQNRLTPTLTPMSGAVAVTAGKDHGAALAAPLDTTKPVVTAVVSGLLGNNEWYRGDVGVTWTVTDPESSITSTTGCSATNLNVETTGTTLTCTATNSAGLTGSASVTIKIDKTPPDVSFTRTAPNAAGWNNAAVLVQFTGTDALSGIVAPSQVDRNVTTEGQNQSASATFADVAGNSVTATVDGINIDLTAPSVQFGTPSPAPNAVGWNNSNVSLGFTAADNLSGVLSTSLASPVMLTSEGSNITSTVTVTDVAGNSKAFTSPAVKIDKTPPVIAFTRTAANASGWNKSAVLVQFTATDTMSGIDGLATIDRNLTTEGKNQSASAAFADLAGNPASMTVDGINIDMTAPTLQFGAASPSPNGAGWNKQNVSFAFTTADNLSGVLSTSSASPLVLSQEGSNVTGNITVSDVAGNSAAFVSPAAKIDKTLPLATANASPQPNANGWNTTAVTVSFNGTDGLSGVTGCSAPVVLNTNGTNLSATGTCWDAAGNVSLVATAGGINININQAVLSITGMPASGCSIWPPNGQLVQIADVKVSDPGASLSITVTSNEPVKASDIVVTGGVVQVRAERLGNGKGRIYSVAAQASLGGNTVQAKGSCIVPHNQ